MRIIGGHDYYDSAMGYGVDPTVVFTRHRHADVDNYVENNFLDSYRGLVKIVDMREEKGEKSPLLAKYHYWRQGFHSEMFNLRKNRSLYVRSITAFVAGVRYAGVYTQFSEGPVGDYVNYFWSQDSANEYLDTFHLKIENGEDSKYKRFRDIEYLEDHFDNRGDARLRDYLVENRISIAISNYDETTRKASWAIDTDGLKEIEFYKMLDSFATYQELSMWVSGVLPREGNPMVKLVDDAVKATKAGFDTKTSFRHPVKLPKPKPRGGKKA